VLAQTLVLCTILMLATTVLVEGVGTFARAQLQNVSQAVIRASLDRAIANAQAQVASVESATYGANADASQYAALAIDADLASELKPPAPTITATGSFAVATTIAFTTLALPQCANPGAAPDVAVALQCSPYIQESRVSGTASIAVYPLAAGAPLPQSTDGLTPLAARTQTFTLRVFAYPPYAALTGVRDGDAADPTSDDPNITAAHEADTGGYAPNLGPLVQPPPANDGDTTIHVVYQCQSAQYACTGTSVPYDQDATQNTTWQNGNAPPTAQN
jgi:hypothetical protein